MLVYTLWLAFFVGFRSDHYGIVAGLFLMFFGSEKTHKIICGIFCFILFAAVYDSLRVLPGHSLMPVHIEDLYNLEKSWFGINTDSGRLTPNEIFAQKLIPLAYMDGGLLRSHVKGRQPQLRNWI